MQNDLPEASRIVLPEITLSVHDIGSGPAVVLCHGFPELAYSWRHQAHRLAQAGFRVIAPDQRGYGASDAPIAVDDYDICHLTSDLVFLLDALSIEQAVFIGHDWGGFLAWAMPLLHPNRTMGVVGVNTPNLPRSPVPPLQMLQTLSGGDPDSVYILWFQKPGVADEILARDIRLLFEKLFRRGVNPTSFWKGTGSSFQMNPFRDLSNLETHGEPILDSNGLETYVRAFERSGFTGPLNWYRNFDRNWEIAPQVGAEKIDKPCLMITAEWDPVLRPQLASGMDALIPELETVMIKACGHWTQQDKPDELNAVLVDWLGRHFL